MNLSVALARWMAKDGTLVVILFSRESLLLQELPMLLNGPLNGVMKGNIQRMADTDTRTCLVEAPDSLHKRHWSILRYVGKGLCSFH